MSAQKLVAQVSMTMLDVDEIETKVAGQQRGGLKVSNDGADLPVRQHWMVLIDRNPVVQERVMVENSWFGFRLLVGPAKAARVRQLQANQQTIGRAASFAVRGDQSLPQQTQLTL